MKEKYVLTDEEDNKISCTMKNLFSEQFLIFLLNNPGKYDEKTEHGFMDDVFKIITKRKLHPDVQIRCLSLLIAEIAIKTDLTSALEKIDDIKRNRSDKMVG